MVISAAGPACGWLPCPCWFAQAGRRSSLLLCSLLFSLLPILCSSALSKQFQNHRFNEKNGPFLAFVCQNKTCCWPQKPGTVPLNRLRTAKKWAGMPPNPLSRAPFSHFPELTQVVTYQHSRAPRKKGFTATSPRTPVLPRASRGSPGGRWRSAATARPRKRPARHTPVAVPGRCAPGRPAA